MIIKLLGTLAAAVVVLAALGIYLVLLPTLLWPRRRPVNPTVITEYPALDNRGDRR